RERNAARHAAQAMARSLSAAQAQGRLSAMAAGDRAAVPRDRAGVAASDGFATGVRTGAPRAGQADGALGAAAARSALYGVAPPLQSRPDAAAAEIRRRGPAGCGTDRGRCDRYRGGVGRAQRMPAPDRRTVALDLAVGAARLPECAEARAHHHRPDAR